MSTRTALFRKVRNSLGMCLLARDKIDSTRKYAPLKKADGAIEIDSSDLTLDQVVETVMEALPGGWRS